jgi:hypothetical protein
VKPAGCEKVFSYTGLNFLENKALRGGGFYIEKDQTSCIVFFKNYLKRNKADDTGGGVYLEALRYPLFFYNMFEENIG